MRRRAYTYPSTPVFFHAVFFAISVWARECRTSYAAHTASGVVLIWKSLGSSDPAWCRSWRIIGASYCATAGGFTLVPCLQSVHTEFILFMLNSLLSMLSPDAHLSASISVSRKITGVGRPAPRYWTRTTDRWGRRSKSRLGQSAHSPLPILATDAWRRFGSIGFADNCWAAMHPLSSPMVALEIVLYRLVKRSAAAPPSPETNQRHRN